MPMVVPVGAEGGAQFTPMAVVVEDPTGRSRLAKKLSRFLSWTGHRAKNFAMDEEEQQRQLEALDEVRGWLAQGGVAVIECGRCPRAQLSEALGCQPLFVECAETLDDACTATTSKAREQLGGQRLSFIRLAGDEVLSRNIRGHLHSQVLAYASAVTPGSRTIYFSRHGESENNVLGKIGGDTDLSERGANYARTLAREMNGMRIPGLRVWTSGLRRTQQTAAGIRATRLSLDALNELEAGVCEGLTYEEMAERYPTEFAWRDQDKLRYRYPWGESYKDIMARVTPVLVELESLTNVLIISHQAVLRCLLGYFLSKQPDELPYLDVPLHTIMKVTTDGAESSLELIRLPVECVDTYRERPKNCSVLRKEEEALLTVPAHFDSLNFGLLEH